MTQHQESLAIAAALRQLAREAGMPKLSRQKKVEHVALSIFVMFD